MADTKRQNAAGKVSVATPNIGTSAVVSQEAALSGVIGARIRLTTNIPSQPTIEGSLFTVCPFTSLLAIATPPPNPVHHVIPISSIQSFAIQSTGTLSAPAPFTNAIPPIAPLPSASLLDRASAAVARLQEGAARKNKSVSKDGQEIFDALSRTLPTRWDGTSIVVMDAVVIASPYKGEDCKAKAGAGQQAGVLPRVKKVLENERKRLADRSTKLVPAVPAMPAVLAGGPRKGAHSKPPSTLHSVSSTPILLFLLPFFPVPVPKEGEVLVKNEYIGVNFIDTYIRSGLYPSPKPEILGVEASGHVVSLGPFSSSSFSIGERVVWMGKASYAEYSTVSVHKASKIPDGISTDTACAAYAQGLTALTMAEEAHRVERGEWALVFGASGGVGGQLCQILRAKAARTMAVVGSRAKVAVARDAGADIVLIDDEDDIVDAVKETTGGEGEQVVFDGVGKETFDRGLECVARKGSMICFGTASGPVPPVPITKLGSKNIKLARPSVFNYVHTRQELEHYTSRLFDLFAPSPSRAPLTVRIHEIYPLSDVVKAHTDIENRKAMGKILLKP